MKKKPVKNSIKGYVMEIRFLQFLHLPDNKIQLKIGILSNHLILYPQLKHLLLGEIIDSFFGILVITTLMKLPMQHPKIKIYKRYIPFKNII
tara:strand:- start:837 stop:1112 length:276 start_codon:yes stop_codon:yes gene_type:complete